jgi:hypothetical protein
MSEVMAAAQQGTPEQLAEISSKLDQVIALQTQILACLQQIQMNTWNSANAVPRKGQ